MSASLTSRLLSTHIVFLTAHPQCNTGCCCIICPPLVEPAQTRWLQWFALVKLLLLQSQTLGKLCNVVRIQTHGDVRVLCETQETCFCKEEQWPQRSVKTTNLVNRTTNESLKWHHVPQNKKHHELFICPQWICVSLNCTDTWVEFIYQ